MNATKTIVRASGVVALAAIGFAVWQSTRVSQMEAAVAAKRTENRTRLERLEARITDLESRGPAATAGATADAAAPGIASLQQEKLAEERRRQQELARQRAQEAKERASAMRQFQFSRDVQQEHFRQFRAELAARYRPLYRTLGLSADQEAQFETLMAERYWTDSDLLAASDTSGTHPAAIEPAELEHQALATFEDGLRTLIGEPGVEQYRNFERVAHAQGLVQSMAARLFDTAEPLTATQADQLLAILADHSRRDDARAPGETWLRARIVGSDSGATVQWTDLDWSTVHPKLDGLLSPRQLAAAQALREEALARQQVKFLREDLEQQLRLKREATAASPPR